MAEQVADYVYIEMIFDDPKKNDVLSGLFRGIIEREGQTFIALKGLGSCTNLVALDFYNIMTIEAREKEYRNMAYCTHTPEDQAKAFGMLEAHHKAYLDAGYAIKKGGAIIDDSKFTNVPKEMGGKELTAKISSGTGSYSTGHTRYTNPTHVNGAYTQTTVKPDPTPGVIKRSKTNKPTKAQLTELSTLLDAIKAGDHELELPETPGDDPDDFVEDDWYDQTDIYGNPLRTHCMC
jgi:hypothetical protein